MHSDFRGIVRPGKSCGQRGSLLDRAILFILVVGKDGDCRIELSEHIHEIAVMRKGDMSGACTRRGVRREEIIRCRMAGLRGRFRSGQSALGGVEVVNQYTVESEICD